jgi:hypothetical protein
MINPACRSLCSNLWVIFSNSAIRRMEGSGFFSFGPRFFGDSASMVPCSACRRQVFRFDEYNPSRRKRAPNRPCSLQASASRRIRRLYSAAKRRRTGFSGTSESGTTDRSARPPVRLREEIPVALRAPSISSRSFETSTSIDSFFSIKTSPSRPQSYTLNYGVGSVSLTLAQRVTPYLNLNDVRSHGSYLERKRPFCKKSER